MNKLNERIKELEKGENLRQILHNLDWIKILNRAIGRRTTSWNFENSHHPVTEWRNASDEICMSIINALEDEKVLETTYQKAEKLRWKQREKEILDMINKFDEKVRKLDAVYGKAVPLHIKIFVTEWIELRKKIKGIK